MVRMRSILKKIHHDACQKTGLPWKIHIWMGFMIFVGLFFTHPASSCSVTRNGFQDFIERRITTNNTQQFTNVKKNGETVLHTSVQCIPLLKHTLDVFIEHKVDFNVVDDDGNTAFLNAVEYGRNASFLTTLIHYGMDWNIVNKNNDTALHVAALHGNLPAVNLLLSMGSNVNAQNSDFRTPLHQAVLSTNVSQNTFEIVSKLVRFGAKTNVSDVNGNSVLQLAKRMANSTSNDQVKNEIVEFLSDIFNRRLTNILDELDKLKLNSTKISRMFQIVQTEDLETIKGVFDHTGNSSDITEIWDENLHSLLHVAINYRDYSVVEFLINSQGFAKKLNSIKFNANLVELCMENIHTVLPSIFYQKLRILQLLLRMQPDLIESKVEWINEMEDEEIGSPLLYSSAQEFSNGKQLELIQMLIDNNANVNATTSENSRTALHLAARNNPLESQFMQIIRILIENDLNANAVDGWGITFLRYLISFGNTTVFHDIVEYLDSINNTNAFTNKDEYDITLLHHGVSRMEVQNETLEIFQRNGVDFNDFGKTIFFTAIRNGRSDSFLKNLIAFGADWRQKDYEENTPLHIAAGWGNLEAVKLFIQLGADVNAKDTYGNTPLHEAFLNDWIVTKLDLVSELINHGANVNLKNKSRKLAVDVARDKIRDSANVEDGIIQLLESTRNKTFQGYDNEYEYNMIA